jgi:hypothetical protein
MSKVHKIFIGSPVYKWPVEQHMAQSVQAVMADERFNADFSAVVGDAHIERARASVLAEYLDKKEDWDYFLNVDWDIEFSPDDLYRMCERDLPILGGPYTFKSDRKDKDKSIVFRPIVGEERTDDYLLKCEFIAGGFTLVRRDLLEQMMETYEDLAFWENPDMHDPPRKTYALWNPILIDREDWIPEGETEMRRELLSEDYSFCKRVLDMGVDIHMDLQTILTHWQDGFPWKLDVQTTGEVTDDNG